MSIEFKVQASVKDNDGDMVNFRADSNEELDSLFANFPYASYAQAKAALRGAGNAAPVAQPHQQTQPPQQPVQQQAPAQPVQQSAWGQQPVQQAAPQQNFGGGPQNGQPHPEGRACQCGATLQWKQFNRKSDGKLLKMWSCPNGRSANDGHESEFVWN